VEGAQEHLLLAKTRRALLPRLMARVRSLHSYDVPEVLVLPVVGGNPTYLSWLNRETKAKTRRKNPTPHQKKASL
jgi:periplasmic divalent cation tolerance protein